MKITKFVHSCILVEMPAPVDRTVLFDPGEMSEDALDVDALEYLDDILITHQHGDHLSTKLIKKLVAKFPDVRITAPQPVVDILQQEGIVASSNVPTGFTLFDSPHERIRPYYDVDPPLEYGYHYLEKFTDPGDSHSFSETKAILALPLTGPWGSVVNATKLALELKPQHIIPIHDWHWNDAARESTYNNLEQVFAAAGITFHKMKTGVPVVIKVE